MVADAYRAHRQALLRYFLRNSVSGAEAEDLLQETYIRLCALARPESVANPRAFLFALARNVLIDSKRREQVRFDFLARDVGGDEGGPTPESQLSEAQEFDRLKKVIESLPLRCRQVLILHRFKGLSHREISEQLGISLAAVEKNMVRALKRCQEAMRDPLSGGDDVRS